jgi:sulfhydrogenase subunit beta (sulfur reductase)
MEQRVILQEAFDHLLAKWLETTPVIGPRERLDQPGFYLFDRLDNPEDFAPDYVTTTIPPKMAFFPPVQTLFSFSPGNPPILKQEEDNEPFVLLGVHPCDLAAIDALDHAYSVFPSDPMWAFNRKRAVIIGIDCLPDEYCFCESMGTCFSREACDLFLTRASEGYVVEVLTPAGDALLDKKSTRKPGARDLEEVQTCHRAKTDQMSASLNTSVADFADILSHDRLGKVWHEVAERCYSCGSCNTTCPACFCFRIDDDFDLHLAKGVRRRSWDSCQLFEFAHLAGSHNFRSDRWQRVRHRWHRKFLYLYKQFGRPYCTGCGRCSRACTADINIVDVSNQLIAYSLNQRKG